MIKIAFRTIVATFVSAIVLLSAEADAQLAPTGLEAVATAVSINLTWSDNSDSETGYYVERSLTGGGAGFSLIADIAANSGTYTDNTALDGITYYYRVQAYNGGGSSSYSNEDNALITFKAPTGLEAVATAVSINLTWSDNSDGETGYYIERSLTGGGTGFNPIDDIAANSGSYTDNTALDGITYYYRVQAYNGGGSSSYSNEDNALIPFKAPTGLEAVATAVSINLTWSDNSDGETGYYIERSLTGGGIGFNPIDDIAANSGSYTDNTALDGITYYYRVQAYNGGGSSSYSNEDNALITFKAPTGLEVVATAVSINLTWSDNSDSETGYYVERSLTGGGAGFSLIADIAANSGTYTDNTALDGIIYYYRVQAYNGGGSSSYSNEDNALITFKAPTGLEVVATAVSINLTWSDNSDGETGYYIERSLTGGGIGFNPIDDIAANSGSYTDNTALDGITYYYRVQAYNGGGSSSYSNEDNALIPFKAPTGLEVVATAVSINLTWSDNSDGETGYYIERSLTGGGVGFSLIADIAANSGTYTDNTALDGITYYYRVQAYNGGGSSSYSNEDNALIPFKAPTGLEAVATAVSINLTWSDNSDSETGYYIERSLTGGGIGFNPIADIAANSSTYTDNTALDGIIYYYRVQAYNGGGNSTYSEEDDAIINLTTPTGLTAIAAVSSINLTWSDNSYSETGYYVERSLTGGGIGFNLIADIAANSGTYTDNTALDGITYYYRVQAYNGGGSSSYSNEDNALITFKAPTGLEAVATAVSINLTWSDNSDGETGYYIERSLTGGGIGFNPIDDIAANSGTYTDNTALDGITYYYRVQAYNGGGSSSYSNEDNALITFKAPTGLEVVATAVSINLTWSDNSDGETGYYIERSLTGGGIGFNPIADIAANSGSYTDNTALDGITYYYRVQAYNGGGSSSYSNEDNALIPFKAPTGLEAVATAVSINLTWSDNSDGETGYYIERSLTGGGIGFNPIADIAANSGSYTDNTALDGITYYYRVQAYNGGGNSTYSEEDDAIINLTTPTGLTAIATAVSINLTWSDNSYSETGYYVERSLTGGGIGFNLIADIAANSGTYTDNTALDGITYYYRVQAYNGGGSSSYSNEDNALITFKAPTGLEVVATAVSINLTWSDNSDGETGYYIERSLTGGGIGFNPIADIAANSGTYTDNTALDGITYYYRVQAYNGGGSSSYSNEDNALITFKAPTGLEVVATAVSINLTWSDNSDGETGYYIERSLTGGGIGFNPIDDIAANSGSYTDNTALDGITYYYRVQAYNGGGSSSYSNEDNALITFKAPTGLEVVATAVSINLTWSDNSDGETGYYIERSLTGGGVGFSLIADIAANSITYTDNTALDGITYYYRVQAYNGGGSSSYSNEDNALITFKAPTGLEVVATAVSINLTWSDNSYSETGYYVERSLTGGGIGFNLIADIAANSGTYTDNTALDGITYYYRVQAYNGGGSSSYSNEDNALITFKAPTGLEVVATAVSINLTWSDNSDGETGYYVERSLTGGGIGFNPIADIAANSGTYTDNTALDGITYYYRVQAYNGGGSSSYSNEDNALITFKAPTGLEVVATAVSINLTWSDNSDGETGYYVERSLTGGGIGFNLIADIAANSGTYTDNTALDGITYYYRVQAYNGGGSSSYSNEDNALITFKAPTGLAAVATAVSINLTWSDNSDGETGYYVERSLTGGGIGFNLIADIAANSGTYTDNTALDGITYYYRVQAYNGGGSSTYSGEDDAIINLTTPTGLTAIATAVSINLTWSDNSDGETGYYIERSLTGGGIGFNPIADIAANSGSYTDNTALDGITYYYRVQAYNGGGSSTYSGEDDAKITFAAPTDLIASTVDESTIDLSWNDNSDSETGFQIERLAPSDADFSSLTIVGIDEESFTDLDLDDNTEYFYRVYAIGMEGNSSNSNEASATTDLAIPDDPSTLTGTATNTCTIELKWSDTSDNELGFEIKRSLYSSFGFVVLDTVWENIVAYTDTSTNNNSIYYYRISAYNDAGNSEYAATSVEISVDLDEGLIGVDQEVCPGGDPEWILNRASPSGGSNNWSYQWQSRIAPAVFSDIPGAITLSYNPPPGALFTTEYQRVSTVECGSVASNIVVITVDDIEDPQFSFCPANELIVIERNLLSSSFTTLNPVFTDNCEVSVLTWSMNGATTGNSPATGINLLGTKVFQLGVTTVTYIAKDLMGNSAQCEFTVTVKIKDPEILDVIIPNAIMNIGDPVTATIAVAEDGGTVYDRMSGSIGGYPLYNFQRLNSTTYMAVFDIVEGGNSYEALEDIPVENLVITDGLAPSEPYNTPISQNKDLLDAALPIVISANLVIGDYKIGDQVKIDIHTDGPGYKINPGSTVNGISVVNPNISFLEIGLGYYQLIYQVEEGDTDVIPGEFVASLIFDKPSGNTGDSYTVIGNVDLVSIDANAPRVTRLEVANEEVGVGGLVVVTITADGIGYTVATGTLINGVPVGSDQVTFEEISNGLYALSYEVSAADNVVAAGDLEMSIILTDEAGNDGKAFAEIEENELEIYTLVPYTTMVTLPEICEGEEAELIVYLVGREPFSFELFDGETTLLFEDIEASPYTVLLSPTETTEYSVPVVTDRNGVKNSGSGSKTVTVNETTPVQITNLETGYSVETAPFKLTADLPGGIFSGPGVNSATGYFDPAKADTINSPHTLYYTYTNPTGCESVDSALVFILGADGDIYLPSSIVCDEAEVFQVSASNVAGAKGSFMLKDSNGNEVAGLIDNDDNTASVDPALLAAGVYTVEYAYLDGVILYIREDFELVFVTQPEILSPLGSTVFCQNGAAVKLIANDPNAYFTGDGVSGSVSGGFIFDPAEAPLGETIITCTVSTTAGCEKSVEMVLEVKVASDVSFTVSSICLPLEGGMISFNNQSTSKLEVKTWSWDFGDPLSGADNYSNAIDPEHFYQTPGERTISLSATTFGGCISRYEMQPIFSSSPNTDFTWISDCFTDNQGVEFVNLSSQGLSAVESVKWVFMSESGEIIDEVLADSPADTIEYQFPEASAYMVALQTVVEGSCGDTLTKMVELRPTYKLSAEGYSEAFDLNTSGWTIESEDENASWVWGTPDFVGFTPEGQGNSWYTDLPAGSSGYMERSWIQSPCFDFSEMDRPMIQMDIMKSFVPNVNGSVLQYMDEREKGWLTIGASSAGINWYNSYNLFNKPGGSPVGWGLDVFNPDTDWVAARHDLSALKGKRFASLRLAIATNGSQGIGNQGFAFDNIMISEKTKLAVLEHFTNSSDAQSFAADILVDSYVAANRSEVIDIQYHTAYPGDDPMNQNNPGAASNRAGNLGVGLVPYAVLDGGATDIYRYDFSDSENSPGAEEVDLLSLEVPSFEIDLEVEWTESMLSTSTTVTCKAESYQEYIQLCIVVLESSITAYEGINGDTEFRNVVLKMLPTPAGQPLGQNWYQGVSMNMANDWTYEPYVEDVADLVVVAFVLDRNTKEILQAAVDYKTPLTGIRDRLSDLKELQLYPNPAKDYLYVNLGSRSELAGVLEVYDLSGRMVMNLETQPGYQIFNLDVSRLTKGMYVIRRIESGVMVGRNKFIKTK